MATTPIASSWTWLSVSHISGPALISTIQACRQQRARVEGPDHVQQFAQLSAVISPWYHSARAERPEDVGTFTDEFPLSDDDLHVRARSKLRANQLQFVRQEALAHRCHRSHEEGQALEARGGPRRSWKKQLDMRFSSPGPRHLRLSPMFRPLLSRCMIRGCRSLGPWRKVSSPPADHAEGLLTEARDRMRADMRFSRAPRLRSRPRCSPTCSRPAKLMNTSGSARSGWRRRLPARAQLRHQRRSVWPTLQLAALWVPTRWTDRRGGDRREGVRSSGRCFAPGAKKWAAVPYPARAT